MSWQQQSCLHCSPASSRGDPGRTCRAGTGDTQAWQGTWGGSELRLAFHVGESVGASEQGSYPAEEGVAANLMQQTHSTALLRNNCGLNPESWPHTFWLLATALMPAVRAAARPT